MWISSGTETMQRATGLIAAMLAKVLGRDGPKASEPLAAAGADADTGDWSGIPAVPLSAEPGRPSEPADAHSQHSGLESESGVQKGVK